MNHLTTMQRAMCIWIPDWPLQRLALARPDLLGRTVVLYEASPQGGLKVAAATAALACSLDGFSTTETDAAGHLIRGIYSSMPLGEAAALIAHAQQASLETSSLEPHLEPADFDADRLGLVELADWCCRFSPIVGVEDGPRPDCLVLDVSGLAHLFGGEQALAEEALRAFHERGLSVRVAIADTLGAAWAAAHSEGFDSPPSAPGFAGGACDNSPFIQIVSPGEAPTALAPLRVEYLRVADETVTLLATLGICRIGQLAALPRSALLARFGPELLRRFDQATGRVSEMIVARHAPPQHAADFTFEAPIANREAIEQVLRELIARTTEPLAQRREGVLRLACRLRYERAFEDGIRPEGPKGNSPGREAGDPKSIHRTRPEGPTQGTFLHVPVLRTSPDALHCLTLPLRAGLLPVGPPGLLETHRDRYQTLESEGTESIFSVTFSLGLFRPSASPDYLCDLLRLRLERVRMAGPVTSVHVEVTAVGRLDLHQQALFEDQTSRDQPRRLAGLIDRLSNRLGRGAVVQVALLHDAQPEYTCVDVPLASGATANSEAKIRARNTARKRAKKNVAHVSRYGLLSFAADERPLWLLPQPAWIEVLAIAPDGVPAQFRSSGRSYSIAQAWGPERIETGWWRPASGEQRPKKTAFVRRDYYRVETTAGARFWIFRQLGDRRWFLQGAFD